MLPPRLEVATSSSGDSAVTVTVSCTRGGRHLQVDRGRLAGQQLEAGPRDGGEALKLRGEVVDADAYRHPEDAALISHGFEPVPRGFEDRRYRDAGQHAARGISDRAGQGRFLRERRDRQGQDCAEQSSRPTTLTFMGPPVVNRSRPLTSPAP